ncbi:MAG: ABC transporter ATP-binding protein [Xanthobacteraceae bacterium]
MTTDAILKVERFSAAYGPAPVVRDVAFYLRPGEITALLGRNGMGKTTLLRGLLGLVPVRRGSAMFAGTELTGLSTEAIARAGIGYVPAGREIFGSLTVRENLLMCARGANGHDGWTLERVLQLFPRLAERIGHGGRQRPGGEQQMLAIGRALMTNPRLLLIDGATEGLAPLVARDIWRTLAEICASGMSAIIVDRDLKRLARIVGNVAVLFRGEIVFAGTPGALLADDELVRKYIGL